MSSRERAISLLLSYSKLFLSCFSSKKGYRIYQGISCQKDSGGIFLLTFLSTERAPQCVYFSAHGRGALLPDIDPRLLSAPLLVVMWTRVKHRYRDSKKYKTLNFTRQYTKVTTKKNWWTSISFILRNFFFSSRPFFHCITSLYVWLLLRNTNRLDEIVHPGNEPSLFSLISVEEYKRYIHFFY